MTIRPYNVNYVNKNSSNDLKRHFGMFGMFLDEFLANLEPPQEMTLFFEKFWFVVYFGLLEFVCFPERHSMFQDR